MPKTQTRCVCQTCGYESLRWLGRCPECDAWNSFVEEIRIVDKAVASQRSGVLPSTADRPTAITAVSSTGLRRLPTGIGELDRVLGGGIVPGALVLVGGDPGIGKSTLLMQVANNVSRGETERGRGGDTALSLNSKSSRTLTDDTIPVAGQNSVLSHSPPLPLSPSALYVSGEESAEQIRLRAERLGAQSDQFLVVNETDINTIQHHIENERPGLVVIDSIQTTYDSALESAPGTVSQVRNCAAALARVAKSGGPPIFLIGHVTKEGSLAGPRVLEHMVDTVLYFEGDRSHAYRVLRAVKNRFGSTDEIGIFQMGEDGLSEVENPSAALLAERTPEASGSAVASTIEGTRPLLVEIQALVARSFLANPRRTATGIDLNRLHMLLAVLEKRIGLRLGDQDIFVNVAGGVRIVEPATDLAVALAVASNFREQPIDAHTILLGEVGLGGEVRSVSQTERRLREAARMGFTRAIVPRHNASKLPKNIGIEVVAVSNVLDAMNAALRK